MSQKQNEWSELLNWLWIVVVLCFVMPFIFLALSIDRVSRWSPNKEDIGWWVSTILGIAVFLTVFGLGIYYGTR